MSSTTTMRAPWPEVALLSLGLVSGIAAGRLGAESWATASAWLCIFSAIAAIVTVALSSMRSGTNLVALVLGSSAAVWGVLWFFDHGDEPYIFSPIIVGYVGGGLALSSLLTLMYRVFVEATSGTS
ncbi:MULTISPECIES: hypothetical protein [Nocardiaceae]|uniref:CHASE2 domain-containing sensor protein n=1 Tax=Rhodococcoides corynebacterioides TaxID=53972 RepID=A0ABS2KUJ1_9NOCA|nr:MULTISPECIES: hypothetical protein [Rhodococcus]MBM7415557.1 CHASE2 domain-containing sensor protein [Rhodococcus corynebacterioides]MBP1118019.1 CHASE2 domain-containing sensor protein [Rhodococcus sp. PvP016]